MLKKGGAAGNYEHDGGMNGWGRVGADYLPIRYGGHTSCSC